jgi:dynein heavy chain
VPGELEKLKQEMAKCFDVYKILEGFNYRFSKDDMDRKWTVFGGTKDVLELIAKREKELEKDTGKF